MMSFFYEGNLSLTFTKCTVKQCLGKTQHCGDWIREIPPKMPKTIDVFFGICMDNWPRYTPFFSCPNIGSILWFLLFIYLNGWMFMVSIISRQTSMGLISHGSIRQHPRVSWRRGPGVSLRLMALVFGSTAHGDPGQNPDGERGRGNVGGVDLCVLPIKNPKGKPYSYAVHVFFFRRCHFSGTKTGTFFGGEQLKELGKHLKCIPKMRKAGKNDTPASES